MNIDFLTSFEDIKKYPTHFFVELCMDRNTSFTLFMYGPYIANHMPECYESYPESKLKLNIQNDLFRLMYEVALLNKIKVNHLIKDAKDRCLTIIERNRTNPYKYSSVVVSITQGMIEEIRAKQYQDNTLESAMLNYAPIVQYAGTIVKPEMETHFDIANIDKNQLESNIVSLLVQNIVQIMLHDESFINIDSMIDHLHKHEEFVIPDGYLNMINTDNIVNIYYELVFFKYIVLNDDISISKEDLINLNKQYNKIIKCENVDIKEAVEAFSKLTTTFDDTSL